MKKVVSVLITIVIIVICSAVRFCNKMDRYERERMEHLEHMEQQRMIEISNIIDEEQIKAEAQRMIMSSIIGDQTK